MSKRSCNRWDLTQHSFGVWYNSVPLFYCGITGEVWSWRYRESEPVSAPLNSPHAAAKPNHRRAYSWLTLSLSLTLRYTTTFYITETWRCMTFPQLSWNTQHIEIIELRNIYLLEDPSLWKDEYKVKYKTCNWDVNTAHVFKIKLN